MVFKLEELKFKLQQMQKLFEESRIIAKEIRGYYKYQGEEADSISEAVVVELANANDFLETISTINELLEYEGSLDKND